METLSMRDPSNGNSCPRHMTVSGFAVCICLHMTRALESGT